jgi:hypothetical protein
MFGDFCKIVCATVAARRGGGGRTGGSALYKGDRRACLVSTLTEVFRAFPQFQGKCQGIIQKGHGPPSPIMEAFS